MLLAQVVSRVSGESFEHFTKARLFEPLGMEHTHFRNDHGEVVKNLAYAYVKQDDEAFHLRLPNYDTVGATDLLTTVEDLARWDENFYSAKVGLKSRAAKDLASTLSAEYVAPALRVAYLVPKLLPLLDIICCVIGMCEVGCPQEPIAAAEIDRRGQSWRLRCSYYEPLWLSSRRKFRALRGRNRG